MRDRKPRTLRRKQEGKKARLDKQIVPLDICKDCGHPNHKQ